MGKISLLLADDSITIQKVVEIIFGGDNYSLTIASNGLDALQKAKEVKPDVLLIDAIMPDMDGYAVCEAIRKEPALSTKPVLLLVGAFDNFDEEKAHQSGADDHIIKPFEAQLLESKVKELYQLGQERVSDLAVEPSGSISTVKPVETVSPSPQQTEASDSPFATEFPTIASLASIAEEGQAAPVEPVKVKEPAAPVRMVDDPWGAFTTDTTESEEPAAYDGTSASFEQDPTMSEPAEDFFESAPASETSAEAAIPATIDADSRSWVPVEEHVFEFKEELDLSSASFTPADVQSAFAPDAPEPAGAAPVTSPDVAQPTAALVPTAEPAVPALTEEQLKAAIMAASKETIERIVWEVVPDLAETLIREAIKRITEDK